MKINKIRNMALGLVLVLLGGCVVTPADLDTNAKRLAAAEIAYSETATLVLNSKDRLSESARLDAKGLLFDGHTALIAARLALAIGDEVDFSSNISTVNSVIRLLRPILESLEQEVNNGYSNQPYSFT